MAELIRLVDSNTRESVNYEEVNTWVDGTEMDDSKVDNIIYRKKGDKYFVDCEFNANQRINVCRFGQITDNASANTTILKNAINTISRLKSSYGRAAIKPSPLPNFLVGNECELYFPAGLYIINDTINYGLFTKIRGNNAIIYQMDKDKDIFFSDSPYENEFEGLVLIGGRDQIVAQNGKMGEHGLEGVMTKVTNCVFQANSGFAVRIRRSNAGGGHQAVIDKCKWFEGSQFAYLSCDNASIKSCWLETGSDSQANNLAWIENRCYLMVQDIVMVPTGNYASRLNRYVDNYASVCLDNIRFGAEGAGGLPFVYNFKDALSTTTYPYQDGGQIIIKNCPIAVCGSTSKADNAYIVLKEGIPHNIIIENNNYSADGPYIRTNLFNKTGFASFAEYFSRPGLNGKRINIRISGNNKWNPSITEAPAATALLNPYLHYTSMTEALTTHIIGSSNVYRLRTKRLLGDSLGTANKTKSSGTLLYDTGIFKNDPITGFGNGALYEVFILHNLLFNGNANYKQPQSGILGVGIGYDHIASQVIYSVNYKPVYDVPAGPSVPSIITAVFWDGTTERATVPYNASYDFQIRLKIPGYQTGTEGDVFSCTVTKRMQ